MVGEADADFVRPAMAGILRIVSKPVANFCAKFEKLLAALKVGPLPYSECANLTAAELERGLQATSSVESKGERVGTGVDQSDILTSVVQCEVVGNRCVASQQVLLSIVPGENHDLGASGMQT